MRIEIYVTGLDAAERAAASLCSEFVAQSPEFTQDQDRFTGRLRVEFVPHNGVLSDQELTQLRLRAERVQGVAVTALGPTPYVSVSRMAERAGLDSRAINEMIHGSHGVSTFPAPLNPDDGEPIWHWPDVRTWLGATDTPVDFDIADGEQDRIENLIAEHNAQLRQLRAAQIFRARIRKQINDEDPPR